MPGQLVPTLAMLVPGHIEHWSQQLVLAINIPPMSESAAAKGADAVVNIRFTTSQITGGAAELLAYGTAVTLSAL